VTGLMKEDGSLRRIQQNVSDVCNLRVHHSATSAVLIGLASFDVQFRAQSETGPEVQQYSDLQVTAKLLVRSDSEETACFTTQ